jgi:alkylation response protein AidB-like acyl-CoA dehydrogenase
MTPVSDDTERLLSDSAASFLATQDTFTRLRSARPGMPAYASATWLQLAAQGWLALRLTEAQGGSGLRLRHAMRLTEAFGRRLLPEPFITGALMPAVLAERLPGAPAWTPILRGLVDGKHRVSVAWQAAPQALQAGFEGLEARARDAAVVLDGVRHGVVAAGFADSLLVSATCDGAPALVAVPRDAPGLSSDDVDTSDGGTLSTLRLHKVTVPASAVLARGDSVEQAMSAALAEATLAIASQLLGVAGAALDITLDYLRLRVQFGQTIGSFQSLQHAAADVRIEQALASASCQAALLRHETAADAPGTGAAIAAAKARASDAALLAGRFGVQAHGAIGFTTEADIGWYLKVALRLAASLGNGSQQRRRYGELMRAMPADANGENQ